VTDLTDSMPEELWDELDVAYRRWDELAAQGRSLRFRLRVPTGVEVDVCDREGQRLHSIEPAEALVVAAGGPLEERPSSSPLRGRSPGER
jgi:hypothetical protein